MSVTAVCSTHAKPVPPLSCTNLAAKVAMQCFKELAFTLALGATVACFVPCPIGLSLIVSAAIVQAGVSLFFHSLGAYSSYKISQNSPHLVPFQRLLSLCQWITGTNFAYFTGYNTQTLIHETGHALASIAIYKRPRPEIVIRPFTGGITQYYKTALTPFGKRIGPVGATCLVIASGPALTLLVSSALLLIGLSLKEKYPQLGKYLICWSLFDFLHHAHYAYSARWSNPTDLTHDFVHLSVFGLSPVAATIGILAIPTLLLLGTQWKKRGQAALV